MSYQMTQQDTQFFMDNSNLEAARQALLAAVAGCKWHNPAKARSLENVVGEFGWSLEFDADGNVKDIEFLWENAGDEKRLFDAIAPFVRPDSFIQMAGGDGELWRWIFDGVRCMEKAPSIVWDEEENDDL